MASVLLYHGERSRPAFGLAFIHLLLISVRYAGVCWLVPQWENKGVSQENKRVKENKRVRLD